MEIQDLISFGIDFFGLEKRDDLVRKLQDIIGELLRWGRRINLTGFRDEESVVRKLVFEALYLLRHLKDAKRVGDLGSGSGMMAIVFALLLNAEIISVERNYKKVSFQKYIKRTFKIDNLHVIRGDIREISPLFLDASLLKAIGLDPFLLEKVAEHLNPGGILLIPRAKTDRITFPPILELEKIDPYKLPLSEVENRLFILRKIGG